MSSNDHHHEPPRRRPEIIPIPLSAATVVVLALVSGLLTLGMDQLLTDYDVAGDIRLFNALLVFAGTFATLCFFSVLVKRSREQRR